MAELSQQEKDIASVTSWTTTWQCPRCKKSLIAEKYGIAVCSCGLRFEVCRQFYGATSRDPYVVVLDKQNKNTV